MKCDLFDDYRIHTDEMVLHMRLTDGRDGKRYVVMPMQRQIVDPYAKPTEPWLVLRGDGEYEAILQAFLEKAWGRGMRPKGFADYKDQLIATKDHLNDMRSIVSAQLKMKLPGVQ